MSKIVVMCARDIKVGCFARPFFVSTVAQAVRSFQDEARRKAPDNQLSQHPEDFELFELGTWDEDTAKFDQLPAPKYIIRADMLIEIGVNRETSEAERRE